MDQINNNFIYFYQLMQNTKAKIILIIHNLYISSSRIFHQHEYMNVVSEYHHL